MKEKYIICAGIYRCLQVGQEKILEQAGTEPEIVKLSRRYERGGDTDGEEHTGAVHRCVRAD